MRSMENLTSVSSNKVTIIESIRIINSHQKEEDFRLQITAFSILKFFAGNNSESQQSSQRSNNRVSRPPPPGKRRMNITERDAQKLTTVSSVESKETSQNMLESTNTTRQ